MFSYLFILFYFILFYFILFYSFIYLFIFVSVQRTAQTSFKTFLQTRIMVDGAKFNSHDSGGHFKSRYLKMAAARKIHISS